MSFGVGHIQAVHGPFALLPVLYLRAPCIQVGPDATGGDAGNTGLDAGGCVGKPVVVPVDKGASVATPPNTFSSAKISTTSS